jgi:hypothetical protein|tara:strand:- start:705 stop:1247 length:543 start_codon:yes stop_codon:yes gene_type:complete
MTDKDDSGGNPLDFGLAKAVRELDKEMVPERDLWPGIERRIADLPYRQGQGWRSWSMPVAVAASFLVAVSTLVMTLYRFEQLDSPGALSFEQSMSQMQTEYLNVRNPLVREFEEANKDLDPETIELIYRNIEIIDQARRELEAELKKNPENQRLMKMLMRLHQQELELLKSKYMENARSI